MDKINKVQKELFRDLKKTEAEVESLQETIDQVKALGHPVDEQEKQLDKVKQHITEAKQRIEGLWEYSIPYGQS